MREMNWTRWAPPALAVGAILVTLHLIGGEAGTNPAPGPATVSGPTSSVASARASTSGPPAAAQSVVADLDFEFYRERVEPIFLEDRGGHGPGASACVTCHVPSGTPLKLQPLEEDDDGGVYWTEEQSRKNFTVVTGLVTPGQPERSRLLREPLAEEAGGSGTHVGGTFWDSQDDPEWQVLAEWVRTADADAPSGFPDVASAPSFEFFRSCVQRIFLDREEEGDRMECAACHTGGYRGYLEPIPEDRDFWNEAESRRNFGNVIQYVEPGYPLRSRFLTHPLDYRGGGDGYHSGGRRWKTQDDPEWQMLAAWVKGKTPACVVEDR